MPMPLHTAASAGCSCEFLKLPGGRTFIAAVLSDVKLPPGTRVCVALVVRLCSPAGLPLSVDL